MTFTGFEARSARSPSLCTPLCLEPFQRRLQNNRRLRRPLGQRARGRAHVEHLSMTVLFPDWTANATRGRSEWEGCCVNTEGLWGIWRAPRPRAAPRQARLCRAAFTHTALIAFASFITFIASSLHCVLPGLVERSLWRLSAEQEMAAGAPENTPIAMSSILFLFL